LIRKTPEQTWSQSVLQQYRATSYQHHLRRNMYPCPCEQYQHQDNQFPAFYHQKTYKQQPNVLKNTLIRKTPEQTWSQTLDLLCWTPDKMKTKLDTRMRTLTITNGQKFDQPWKTSRMPKSKQVIPLPQNIDMMMMQMHVDPKARQMVLTAPLRTQQKKFKNQPEDYHFGQELETLEDLHYSTHIRKPHQLKKNQIFDKYNIQAWSWPWGSSNKVTTLDDKMLTTEVKKDEKTGKWNLILDVNTVLGFKKEEVKVTFKAHQADPILVIEAKRDLSLMQGKEGEVDVFVKVLREEIIVPREVEGKQLRYTIKKDGVLRIQLPCLRNPSKTAKDTEEKDNQYAQQ